MIETLSLTTALVLGLLGGAHCLGMCGGIAATVSMSTPSGGRGLWLLTGYNTGRIFSYTLAGGLIGSISWLLESEASLIAMRTLAGLMLVAMGLYVAQWWQGLVHLEKAGSRLWQGVRPLASRLLPVKNLLQALTLGALWGWLPCGLVYSTLIWASAAADWQTSAQLMMAFGIGTLPTMLLTGVLAHQVKQVLQKKITKNLFGSLIIFFGIYTIPWAGITGY